MKVKMKILVYAIAFIFSGNLIAQNIDKKIETAFKSGNTELLSTTFNDKLEIIIPAYSELCSKQQAKMVLKNFFTKNKPVSFVIKHNNEKNNIQILIGELKTAENTFRVNILLKLKDNNYLINQIRITK